MANNPLVSIICPVYLAEDYINKCVDSIISQSLYDWELLLIDDGSPDLSGLICDSYAQIDNRIKVIHKRNGGVSSARQTGLENALGEFIIHVDPDDWIESDMLQVLVDNAICHNADLVICDYYEDYSDEEILKVQKPSSLSPHLILPDFFTRLHGSCCNKLVRRKCFESFGIRFPDGWSMYEDQYVTVSLLMHDIKISYVNEAFYHYVIGQNNNSISKRNLQTYEYDVMIYNTFDLMTSGSSVNNLVRKVYGYFILEKEFLRHTSSSLIYSKRCLPYINSLFGHNVKLITQFKYILSCLGFYRVVYCFIEIVKK